MIYEVRCTNCNASYPGDSVPYRCLKCGGVFDYVDDYGFVQEDLDSKAPGIWKYRSTFGLQPEAEMVYLGEGDTPLVWSDVEGRKVAFKLEYLNPTGSFKDRGTAVLTSFLASRGVKDAVEDSSGNAGASFAAYAAKASIHAKVFVPDYASGPKRKQIEVYGAEVVPVPGKRSNASEAVKRAADSGAIYASHAYLPFGLPGFATIAYEILEQLGEPPGTVVAPVGQGSLILGIGRGFKALKKAGLIDRLPKLVGVQAIACAPIWAVFTNGAGGLMWVTEGETLAEGVRIFHPLRGDMVLRLLTETDGVMVAVNEEEILPGQDELAKRGFFVEPTSAIVWDGIKQVLDMAPDPIVAILSGSGFKSIGS